MTAPDPRRTPYRPDLAAAFLRGSVAAPRYAEGTRCRVQLGCATMRGQPDTLARQISQVLFGETVTVYDRRDGWAWGQNESDGYVGYVPAEALTAEGPEPTHVVTALGSFLFPEPNLKSPPLDRLPLGALCSVAGRRDGYLALADGGWLFAGHLAALDGSDAGLHEPDLAATAARLLGVPYLWGGRTPAGIDCSGLVQLAVTRSGRPCPRDSDMQRAELGELVSEDGRNGPWRRGDMVFFPGHVGVMADAVHLLHAAAAAMMVVCEPLDVVADRAGGILAVRRLTASE